MACGLLRISDAIQPYFSLQLVTREEDFTVVFSLSARFQTLLFSRRTYNNSHIGACYHKLLALFGGFLLTTANHLGDFIFAVVAPSLDGYLPWS